MTGRKMFEDITVGAISSIIGGIAVPILTYYYFKSKRFIGNRASAINESRKVVPEPREFDDDVRITNVDGLEPLQIVGILRAIDDLLKPIMNAIDNAYELSITDGFVPDNATIDHLKDAKILANTASSGLQTIDATTDVLYICGNSYRNLQLYTKDAYYILDSIIANINAIQDSGKISFRSVEEIQSKLRMAAASLANSRAAVMAKLMDLDGPFRKSGKGPLHDLLY